MQQTLIAFSLMALVVVAGVVIGFYLRHNVLERSIRRGIARENFQREAIAVSASRNRITLTP